MLRAPVRRLDGAEQLLLEPVRGDRAQLFVGLDSVRRQLRDAVRDDRPGEVDRLTAHPDELSLGNEGQDGSVMA